MADLAMTPEIGAEVQAQAERLAEAGDLFTSVAACLWAFEACVGSRG